MAGRGHHIDFQAADCKCFTVAKQILKLRSIIRHFIAQIVNLLEGRLNGFDHPANTNLAAKLLLQVRGRGQMIGVNMGFQYPFNAQPFRLYE